jgi:heme/copper-type cytochrome/quinol oxidase subunit 3
MTTAAKSGFREATEVPTGRLGIWWFLASEIVIFGGLIACYLLFRWRHPEWGAHAHHTVNAAGAFNTMVLLTSGATSRPRRATSATRCSAGGSSWS